MEAGGVERPGHRGQGAGEAAVDVAAPRFSLPYQHARNQKYDRASLGERGGLVQCGAVDFPHLRPMAEARARPKRFAPPCWACSRAGAGLGGKRVRVIKRGGADRPPLRILRRRGLDADRDATLVPGTTS